MINNNFKIFTQKVLGEESQINFNTSNFEIYNNKHYNDFPLEIVVHDLSFLNAQVQKQYTVFILGLKK